MREDAGGIRRLGRLRPARRVDVPGEVVPPGRYVLHGRPNPGSDGEQTAPVAVDLKGGQTAEVTLKAK